MRKSYWSVSEIDPPPPIPSILTDGQMDRQTDDGQLGIRKAPPATWHNGAKKVVMTSIICHDVKKVEMTSNTRNDVMMLKGSSLRQMYVMSSKVRHDVKNTSWLKKHVCHDIKKHCHDAKKFVMISKIRHDAKKFAMK